MINKKEKNKNTNGRRILLLSILCLFVFCLVAQVQPKRNTAQPARSKVYLLHSDVLKKNKKNPDAQIVTTSWNEIDGAEILSVMEKRETLEFELNKLKEEAEICPECGHKKP